MCAGTLFLGNESKFGMESNFGLSSAESYIQIPVGRNHDVRETPSFLMPFRRPSLVIVTPEIKVF